MRMVRRLFWALLGIVGLIGISFLAVIFYLRTEFQDVIVLSVESPECTYEFWIERSFLEENYPHLSLRCRDRDSGKYRGYEPLGWMRLWNIDTDIDLREVRFGELAAVVVDHELAKPLLLWEVVGTEVFSSTESVSDASKLWLSRALGRISRELREPACLGYFSTDEVKCRIGSPVAPAADSEERTLGL